MIQVGFITLFLVLILRSFIIHIFPPSSAFLDSIAKNQYSRQIKSTAFRGSIIDRKGELLAFSVKKPSIAINPKVFNPSPTELDRVAKVLKLSRQKLAEQMSRKSYFVWLKRNISHERAKSLEQMELQGLHIITEPARYYPKGKSLAHIIGFTDIDFRGQAGIERTFDRELRGESSNYNISVDARGNTIFLDDKKASPEQTGYEIKLTIDDAIQEIAYKALMNSVEKSNAKSGFALVSDPHTGQLLAIANYPSFDPNYKNDFKLKNSINHALNDSFEPGSVVKPLGIAYAMEKQFIKKNDKIFCENGKYKVGPKNFIHDDKKLEWLTVTEIIAKSSNICTFKVFEKHDKKHLYDAYTEYGIGSREIKLNLPGEGRGFLRNYEKWKPIEFSNISFGQGITVTGLELVQAFSVIANGGVLLKPYVISEIKKQDGSIYQSFKPTILRRILSEKTSTIMKEILQNVTSDHGTAPLAESEIYTTAGKTGTAEKVDPLLREYSKDKRIASFIGFAPASDPHLMVLVVIDEPHVKPYYGGIWAAPVFKEIVDKSLKYLNVTPDKVAKVATLPQGQDKSKALKL